MKNDVLQKFELEKFYDELDGIIRGFGTEGRIFSNEEQFQFALAWKLKEAGYNVRLEVLSCPKDEQIKVAQMDESQKKDQKIKKMYTDIVVDIDDVQSIAIELKYKTLANNKDKRCIYPVGNHKYVVFQQGAPNIGCYQYLEDVVRLEELVGIANQKHEFDSCNLETRKVVCGFAIIITNDDTYWQGPKTKNSVMEQFFLYDNTEDAKAKKIITGVRKSDEKSKREYMLNLKGEYTCGWKDYYHENDSGKPDFRYLILQIPPKETN